MEMLQKQVQELKKQIEKGEEDRALALFSANTKNRGVKVVQPRKRTKGITVKANKGIKSNNQPSDFKDEMSTSSLSLDSCKCLHMSSLQNM